MARPDMCPPIAFPGFQNSFESRQSKNYSLPPDNSGLHSTSTQHRWQSLQQSRVLRGALSTSRRGTMATRPEIYHSISTSHSSILPHDPGLRQRPSPPKGGEWNHRVVSRSEEHTSELQSRPH